MSQIKVGVGIGVKEGSDCRLRGKHIQCCCILPVEEDLSLCQAVNSKCLALKVFPTLTSAMEEETAVSKGLGDLESNALDRGVARVLGGNTGGSLVSGNVHARWARVTCCPRAYTKPILGN